MRNVSERDRGGGRDFLGALCCGALVILFFLILLWRDPLLFWNDDYQLSILPVFADVARSWSEGHLPLLSPYSWVCGNLAGEFQYGTFSVFVNAAVVLIWKLPLTFPQQAAALSLAHLVVLAVGGYLLGRGRKLSQPLAFMVGLVAALNGWIVCWGATDWFGALGAFAWLPWAWWGMERALGERRGRFRFLWPAPFVYLLVTGGFPYTVVMLAVLAAWLALRSITRTHTIRSLGPLIVGMALGVGMAAPAWLALFDYVSGSARQVQEASAHWQWLVPAGALPGFILPGWTVGWTDFFSHSMPHTATEMAAGFVAPIILLFALSMRARAVVRQLKWELGLLVLVLALSMLPTANMFRWSFRWLPFLHLVLVLCAAEAVAPLSKERLRRLWNAGTFALVLLAVIGAAMALLHTAGPYGWLLFVAMLAIAAVWAVTEMVSPRSWMLPLVTFASFLATYLCIPPNCGVPKYNLAQALTEPAPLDPQRLYLSVYPAPEFSYRSEVQVDPFGTVVRPGSTSMWGGVRLINGYSPIRPAGVAREFDVAIHGEIAPWAGEYALGWQADADGKLARMGVDGIIVARALQFVPQPVTEWELAHSSDEGRVYHRRGGPLPRIQSLTEDDARPGEQYARASIERITESRYRVEADVVVPTGDKSALLLFSRPFFRGYVAHLGKRELTVTSWRGLTPALEVPGGMNGRLTLVYRPWWLLCGGAVAALCAGAFLVGLGLSAAPAFVRLSSRANRR